MRSHGGRSPRSSTRPWWRPAIPRSRTRRSSSVTGVRPRSRRDRLAARAGAGRSSPTGTAGGGSWAVAAAQTQWSRSGRSGWLLEHGAVVICAGGGGVPDRVWHDPEGDATLDRRADADRRRGRHRQGPRERAARARGRRRPLRDGDRRRRRVRGWGTHEQRRIDRVTPAELRRYRFAARLDGPEGRRGRRFVGGHRAAAAAIGGAGRHRGDRRRAGRSTGGPADEPRL